MNKPILLIEKPAALLWGGILSWMFLLAIFFAAAALFTWAVTPDDSPPPIDNTFENLPVIMSWEATSEGPQLSEHFRFADSRGRIFECQEDVSGVQ